ncbi:MAG: NIPSNAP family protein [Chloroflexota bacterium]
MTKTTQLRIYTINRGEMDEFVKGWREKIIPIRLKHGYAVEGGWVMEGENRFVWMVSYEGDESWEDVEKAYYNDPERLAITPGPAIHIALMELRFIKSVLEHS